MSASPSAFTTIKKAKVIKILAGYNLDKVFKVDLKNNKIITAGQDGRCVVYNLNNNKTYFLREEPNWFLIYASALSPSGKLGAYSSDENNSSLAFDKLILNNTDISIKNLIYDKYRINSAKLHIKHFVTDMKKQYRGDIKLELNSNVAKINLNAIIRDDFVKLTSNMKIEKNFIQPYQVVSSHKSVIDLDNKNLNGYGLVKYLAITSKGIN